MSTTWRRAAEAATDRPAAPGVYELGGPEVATFRELMQTDARRHPAQRG